MMAEFSVRLRKLRTDKHLTQEQVARRVGISRSMVSQYETDIKNPSFDILVRFASIYGCTVDYLLRYEVKRYVDISGLTDEQAASVIEIINQYEKCNAALGVVADYREVI